MGAEPRIFVVDDSPQIVDFYSLLLLRMGCIPVSASNGEDALKYLGNAVEPFSLIILDLLMPGITGWETLLKIRESKTHGTTPVIVITGMELPEEQRKRLLKHCQKIMIKTDFNISKIRSMITELLASSPKTGDNSTGNPPEQG